MLVSRETMYPMVYQCLAKNGVIFLYALCATQQNTTDRLVLDIKVFNSNSTR